MVSAAKRNLKTAGEKRRVRRVVADAGYWSVDNVGLKGVESFFAPGRARQLKKIAETEQARAGILNRAGAGEIDTQEAAEQLGVTTAKVNQLLRRHRAGDPDPLTTTMIAKTRQSARPQDLQEASAEHRARRRPDQTQSTHPNHLPTRADSSRQ